MGIYSAAYKAYVQRSFNYIKDHAVQAVRADIGWKSDLPMFQFRTVEHLEAFSVGSDADIGGYSEAYWGLTPEKTGLFWGKLSEVLPPNSKIERSGYAGLRSNERPLTLLHRPRFDTSQFRYLAIRAKGDNRQWMVNLQCDSIYPTLVWQHRIYFQRPGEWEIVMIPFRDFVLTSHGYVQARQLMMDRAKIKSVGFSIVRQTGDFSLELDWIKAVNTPDTVGETDIRDSAELRDVKPEPWFIWDHGDKDKKKNDGE